MRGGRPYRSRGRGGPGMRGGMMRGGMMGFKPGPPYVDFLCVSIAVVPMILKYYTLHVSYYK